MKRIVAVTACPTSIAHTMMAAEALKRAAQVIGHQIKVETQGSEGTQNVLAEGDIAAADVVLLAVDIRVDPTRFAGKPLYETRTSEAIRNTRRVIEDAVALAEVPAAGVAARVAAPASAPAAVEAPRRIVGITSCPTASRTFMAAEALQKAVPSARPAGARHA